MAAPSMSPDVGFSNAMFGIGAGLFFLGCFLAEIPSNLMPNKVGAGRCTTHILLAEGIVSGPTGFVWNSWNSVAMPGVVLSFRGRLTRMYGKCRLRLLRSMACADRVRKKSWV